MSHTIQPLGQSELHDVLNYAPVGVLVEDCAGTIVWINHTLEWQLGVNSDSMVGVHTSELPLEPLPGARGKRVFRAPYAYGSGCIRYLKCIEDILPEYSDTGIRVRYFLETREERPPEFRNDLMRLLENRSSVDPTTGLRDQDGSYSNPTLGSFPQPALRKSIVGGGCQNPPSTTIRTGVASSEQDLDGGGRFVQKRYTLGRLGRSM